MTQRHPRQGNSRAPHRAGESLGQAQAAGNHQQVCGGEGGRRSLHILLTMASACVCLSQTCKYLSPEDLLKGLQGEPQETLEGIKLAISTMEKFFQSYSTYCSDLMPTLFPVGAGMVQELLTPSTPAPD